MALNLDNISSVNIQEPVTHEEMQLINNNYNAIRQEAEQEHQVEETVQAARRFNSNIIFASDFRKDSSLPCKFRPRKKKKDINKKRREQQEREQASRNGKVRKYTKEMRNRDAIEKAAKDLRREAIKTATLDDDRLINSAMSPGRKFDKIIYGTVTSDVEDKFEDLFDDANDD